MAKRVRYSPWMIATVCLSVALLVSLYFNWRYVYRAWEGTQVVRVLDGDTFQLADGRRVRLLGIDAPEHGRCMASESAQMLSGLVLSKHVLLEDTKQDEYGRVLANVFTGPALINDIIVRKGLARSTYEKSSHAPDGLVSAQDQAKAAKRGIFSDTCRTTDPKTNCVIKGNIKNGKKTYHLPGCDNYDQTIIDASYGDAWFCTEKEARAAGFVKASGCR